VVEHRKPSASKLGSEDTAHEDSWMILRVRGSAIGRLSNTRNPPLSRGKRQPVYDHLGSIALVTPFS
jgi:hypothetical protein